MKTFIRQFLFGAAVGDNRVMNIGWLLFRVHVGVSIAIHAGWPKMSSIAAPGWFVDQVAGLGFNFPSPAFWAAMASWGEFVGGICIALGLLTRFSALQLAFQFFVISFLWYDNPEPLTGMYFQQLLFWCFVLICFGGGGRYSLDKMIMNYRIRKIELRKPALVVLLILLSMAGNTQQQQKLSMKDIKPALGKWKGSLTYLDYSSNQPYSMPANLIVEKSKTNPDELDIRYEYPDEPKANESEALLITDEGRTFGNEKIVSIKKSTKDSIEFVTELSAVDGNDSKPALLHRRFIIGPHSLVIRKEVKFEGEEKFILRHEYRMRR